MKSVQTALRAFAAASALILPLWSHGAQSVDSPTSPTLHLPGPGEARELDEKGLDALLNGHGHDLLVINLWATFCGPCVEELPGFIALSKEYGKTEVLFVGLSADLLQDWRETVPPFLKAKKVPYPNFVLRLDPGAMIARFSRKWDGLLPATFFFDRSGRQLAERLQPLTREELRSEIDKQLKAARDAARSPASKPAGNR